MVLVNLAITSTVLGTELKHTRNEHQSNISSPTSPFLPQALQAMAHTRDTMFSASLKKHEKKQKGQRRSQSWSSATNHTQGEYSNREHRRCSHLPFQDEQSSALSLWPSLSSNTLKSHRGLSSLWHSAFLSG